MARRLIWVVLAVLAVAIVVWFLRPTTYPCSAPVGGSNGGRMSPECTEQFPWQEIP